MSGNIEMTKFCNMVSEGGVFKSAQSCRNAITKAEKKGLIIKNGNNKKLSESYNGDTRRRLN